MHLKLAQAKGEFDEQYSQEDDPKVLTSPLHIYF